LASVSPPAAVLVVDDELEIRNFMQSVLEDEGLAVLGATTGKAAAQVVAASPVSLVVLDWGLPDTQADALARVLRQSCGERLPILLVTADSRAASKAQTIRAFAYLNKPFNLDDFVSLVHSGLQL